MKKESKENIIIIGIIILSIILSTIFIFDKITYQGVDTEYHMSRIIGIVNSWKAGNVPAYIHLDTYGYGYAMGFFYSNIFMIIPCLLYAKGVNIMIAYKIFILLCSIFTAISMYFCSKEISKSKYCATISTVLYTTCSYRIITMVIKSFAGEILSFIFIPIIILGLYELIFNDEKKWWLFALGFIGILNSNLVMTEIMIVISLAMVICNIKTIFTEKARLIGFIKATGFALIISAGFWMPLIEQLVKSTFVMTKKMVIYSPIRWLLDFSGIFSGFIQYKNNIAAGYGLGLIFIVILLFRLKIKENNKIIKFCDISILIGLVLLLCMTNFFPWKKLEKIGEMLQFPSRMEIPVSAFFSIACGIICGYLAKKGKKTKIAILAIIVVYQSVFSIVCLASCVKEIEKQLYVDSKEKIAIEQDFKYNVCDGIYLPQGADFYDIQMNMRHLFEREKYTTNNDNLEVIEYEKENLNIKLKFQNNNEPDSYIEVPMFYYYGYVAVSDNNSEYKIEKGPSGKIRVYLGENEKGTIEIYYKNTVIQKTSIVISVVSTVAILGYVIVKKRGEKNQKRISEHNNSCV